MKGSLLQLEMMVKEVLEGWPETAVVFQDYTAACTSCDLGAFFTRNEYQINPQVLLQDLQTSRTTNHDRIHAFR
jgi:hypothetical protein